MCAGKKRKTVPFHRWVPQVLAGRQDLDLPVDREQIRGLPLSQSAHFLGQAES